MYIISSWLGYWAAPQKKILSTHFKSGIKKRACIYAISHSKTNHLNLTHFDQMDHKHEIQTKLSLFDSDNSIHSEMYQHHDRRSTEQPLMCLRSSKLHDLIILFYIFHTRDSWHMYNVYSSDRSTLQAVSIKNAVRVQLSHANLYLQCEWMLKRRSTHSSAARNPEICTDHRVRLMLFVVIEGIEARAGNGMGAH